MKRRFVNFELSWSLSLSKRRVVSSTGSGTIILLTFKKINYEKNIIPFDSLVISLDDSMQAGPDRRRRRQ